MLQGIDSISLNPDSLLKTMVAIVEAERAIDDGDTKSSAHEAVVTGADR